MSSPIWRKQAYPHVDKPTLQKVFFQKLTQFSMGSIVLGAPDFNKDGFLLRDTCVPKTAAYAYLQQTEAIFTLYHIPCRSYSFPKLPQFS
jgi:hypothetical protein